MTYLLLINGNPALQGNTASLIFIIFISFMLLAGIISSIWRRLRENAVLKYEFITIIAHKFRTPLTHIKWIAEEKIAKTQDAGERESLIDLENSTDHLIKLTGVLVELTETDTRSKSLYKFESASLSEMTKEITSAARNMFHEKNISFFVQIPPEDIMVKMDKPRMEFVIQTLLDNSYTYTPTGRRVDVAVGASRHKAIFAVSDNGIGIDSNDIPHIFDKFFRAPNAKSMDTEGFGIGLFMANSIVKKHGGKIEIFSAGKDRGAMFKVILPMK
ncbi:MAG: HAMP domain-containing sensor histidine kinase [Candidatus Taylorbacteria bacterium]|nr:HAMP domain-containing sensor histidine kinase [Candidatus Taylorbacteria bacterium]